MQSEKAASFRPTTNHITLQVVLVCTISPRSLAFRCELSETNGIDFAKIKKSAMFPALASANVGLPLTKTLGYMFPI